jgi:hypothetical protein
MKQLIEAFGGEVNKSGSLYALSLANIPNRCDSDGILTN